MAAPKMMNVLLDNLARPLHLVGVGLELRRLRRKWPSVHRRLVSTPQGTRRESDEAYLERLRKVDNERRCQAHHSPVHDRRGGADGAARTDMLSR